MIAHVHPAHFDAWLADNAAGDGHEGPLVLDVREPWEIQTASVRPDGFTLLSIPMGELAARVAELNPDRPTACLCHHGVRSLRVAQFLAHHGFSKVVNLSGGIEAWSEQRDPQVPRY